MGLPHGRPHADVTAEAPRAAPSRFRPRLRGISQTSNLLRTTHILLYQSPPSFVNYRLTCSKLRYQLQVKMVRIELTDRNLIDLCAATQLALGAHALAAPDNFMVRACGRGGG